MMRVLLFYPPVLLVIGSLLSDALAATGSVVLVILYVGSLMAGWWPGFLAAAVASSLVLPVLLTPYLGYWSLLLALPAVGSAGHGLTNLASALMATQPPARRTMSPLASSIGVALAAMVLLAVVLSLPVLALAGTLFALVMGAGAAVEYVRIGPRPLVAWQQEISARAGERVDVTVELRSERPGVAGYVRLAAGAGVSLRDAGPFPLEGRIQTGVSFTPLLGGPTNVAMSASVTDACGLIHLGQSLDVARLNVVPRARVARWAAEEFLERREGGLDFGRTLSGQVAGFLAGQAGVEYLSSRMYQPGDSLLSVDWKHTARLQSLVVKTFDDGARSAGMLLVNLSATSADEADRLVYESLSAALTVASMSHSASLAVYDDSGDGHLSPVLDGYRLVKEVLASCADVRVVPEWRRELRPLSAQDMHSREGHVRRVGGDRAPRLARLLALRQTSMRTHIEGAPASTLLRDAARRYRPAWCITISAMHRDAEAVMTGLQRIAREGIRTKMIDVGAGVPHAG
jgi:uncharacterized protein (DUF58 family)